MSALQKLKAYFGMVPADDDAFDPDDDYRDDYRADYRDRYLDDDYDDYAERPSSRRRRFDAGRAGYRGAPEDVEEDYEPAGRGTRGGGGRPVPAVQGSLAMESRPESVTRLHPVPEHARQQASYPMGRIVTLHPSSFQEARTIGEHYRDGTPVIMNVTDLDDGDARRLVDFAAGLAFALRGSIDKVTNKVFLLSPPDVDVSAEDKRRIAEGGLFLRG